MEEESRRARERLAREEAIIAASEKVFLRKGFDSASMDEIAEEAEFTKRTLYQYFKSKEDLYLAVVVKGFALMVDSLAGAGQEASSGYQKIRLSFRALYAFYRDHGDTFRLISRWSYVRSGSLGTSPGMGKLQLENRRLFDGIALVMKEGIADGSIESGLDLDRTMCSLVFLVTGFLSQLATTGESFTRQFSLDPEEFCFSSIDMVLESLRPAARSAPGGRSL
jgi:AcrR family transcriptional regulator